MNIEHFAILSVFPYPITSSQNKYTFTLKPGANLLGNAPECDIVVPFPDIAPEHCLINFNSPDNFTIEDLNSLEGVYRESPTKSNKKLQPNREYNIFANQPFYLNNKYKCAIESRSNPMSPVKSAQNSAQKEAPIVERANTPKSSKKKFQPAASPSGQNPFTRNSPLQPLILSSQKSSQDPKENSPKFPSQHRRVEPENELLLPEIPATQILPTVDEFEDLYPTFGTQNYKQPDSDFLPTLELEDREIIYHEEEVVEVNPEERLTQMVQSQEPVVPVPIPIPEESSEMEEIIVLPDSDPNQEDEEPQSPHGEAEVRFIEENIKNSNSVGLLESSEEQEDGSEREQIIRRLSRQATIPYNDGEQEPNKDAATAEPMEILESNKDGMEIVESSPNVVAEPMEIIQPKTINPVLTNQSSLNNEDRELENLIDGLRKPEISPRESSGGYRKSFERKSTNQIVTSEDIQPVKITIDRAPDEIKGANEEDTYPLLSQDLHGIIRSSLFGGKSRSSAASNKSASVQQDSTSKKNQVSSSEQKVQSERNSTGKAQVSAQKSEPEEEEEKSHQKKKVTSLKKAKDPAPEPDTQRRRSLRVAAADKEKSVQKKPEKSVQKKPEKSVQKKPEKMEQEQPRETTTTRTSQRSTKGVNRILRNIGSTSAERRGRTKSIVPKKPQRKAKKAVTKSPSRHTSIARGRSKQAPKSRGVTRSPAASGKKKAKSVQNRRSAKKKEAPGSPSPAKTKRNRSKTPAKRWTKIPAKNRSKTPAKNQQKGAKRAPSAKKTITYRKNARTPAKNRSASKSPVPTNRRRSQSQSNKAPLNTRMSIEVPDKRQNKTGGKNKAKNLKRKREDETAETTQEFEKGKRPLKNTKVTTQAVSRSRAATPAKKTQSNSQRGNRSSSRKSPIPGKRHSYQVSFSGLEMDQSDLQDLKKQLEHLGIKIVEGISKDCNVLVMDKFKRTVKFLYALSRGVDIVDVKWAKDCINQKTILDLQKYQFSDKSSEKKYGFSLKDSLEQAREEGDQLLRGWKIYLGAGIKPSLSEIHQLVETMGAQPLKTKPKHFDDDTLIVLDDEDQKVKKEMESLGYKAYNPEFLFDAVMKQDVNFAKHLL